MGRGGRFAPVNKRPPKREGSGGPTGRFDGGKEPHLSVKIKPRLAAGLLRHASKRTKFTGFVGMTKPLSVGASLVPARTAIVR